MRRMTKMIGLAILGLGALLPICAEAQRVAPPSPDDMKLFNEQYQAKLKIAYRTSEKEDDAALLDEMLGFAEGIPDDPGVQQLIYVEAIRLAASASDIISIIEASDRLDKLVPGHPSATTENLITLSDRAFRMAPRDKRDIVGETFIDLLMTCTEVAAEKTEYKQASIYSKQAQTTARAIGSERENYAQALAELYTTESGISQKIDLLTKAIERNPKNRPAAEDLVKLLLIKRDNPEAASAYTELISDRELAELVTLSAQGTERATAATAVRLGDWYIKLSENEIDHYAQPLLERGRMWYAHFSDRYTRRDTLANRVKSRDEVAIERIDQIVKARMALSGESIDEGWVSLFQEPFDPERDIDGEDENWEVQDGVLMIKECKVTIPLKPDDAYEIRAVVTVTNEDDDWGMYFFLPFKEGSGAMLRYGSSGERLASLNGTKESASGEDMPSRIGKKVELLIQIAKLEEGDTAIALLMDGKDVLKWQGEEDSLELKEWILPSEDYESAFKMALPATLMIHQLDYRKQGE